MDILPQLILNSVIAGALYTMIALGFNLIYSTARFFDLGYGVLMIVGGYGVFYLNKQLGWDIFPSVVTAVMVAGVIGYGAYRAIYHPLRKKKAGSMVLMITSLGFFTAVQAVIAILFTSQFQTLHTFGSSEQVYTIFGGVMTQVQLSILLSGFVLMLLLVGLLRWTRFGKVIRAIGDDEEVAQMSGVDTGRVVGKVFFVSSAIAGLAGILIGFDTGIEPTMGMSLLLKGVIASIVGGIGNVFGGVLGAFLLGFVENFGIWKISGEWKDAIAFVLLIVFLLWRPQGILGKKK